MKQIIVPSLLFLCIVVGVFFNSCTINVNYDEISSQMVKKIDSLNSQYDIAFNNSNAEEKRLEAIDRFLLGTKKLELDSMRCKGLSLYAKLLNKYRGPEKAIDQSYLLLKLAKQTKDSFYISRALYRLGYYNREQDNHLEAFKYYNQAFKIRRDFKDSVGSGRCLMEMSNVQKTLGDYNAAKTIATDGLRYVENSTEYRIIAGLCQSIAISFNELGSQEEALFWNSKILNLYNDSVAKKKIGTHNLPIFKNSRAIILARQKNYQESIHILQALLKNKNVIQKRTRYAQILCNLGYIKFLQNSENIESETMLLEALSIRQQEKDIFGLYSSNLYLARYYKNKNFKKTRHYANEAYENVKDFRDYEALLQILTLITELNPNSLEDHQRFKDASLKLMELRKKTREIYAPTRFENASLLKQNEAKNRKITEVRNQNAVYLLGILLLFISIIFVAYFFRQRTHYLSQQNRIVQFQASYETETRIAKRLHDELGNDIFQVMLQYQKDPYDPQIKDKLNSTYVKARDISRENNEFDTGSAYAEELNNMLQNYALNGVQLIVVGFNKIDWSQMDETIKITIYRVLQELMTNMQKHSKASLVKLMFSKTNDILTITYSDNGVGIAEEGTISKNGLRNTEKRIKALHGKLIFDSEKDKGFKAKIEIPN
ncbi:tetratricopeptide repeat-containing sensor histidine kinase [Aquimarina longa]|uniref:tetratricopeptide repeat-containing sensor histidine kinase n=1 Tax=Aquimarina longa TaxID=1080221 RepID=UPI000ABF242D|nr:tetratricopeptide repeat-containing sensor histidine kinase [Aquimarina longa]